MDGFNKSSPIYLDYGNDSSLTDALMYQIMCELISGFYPNAEINRILEIEQLFAKTPVYIIAFIIFAFGLIGNIITIAKITFDPRFKRPVFICLRCLATADLTSLIIRYTLNFTTLQRYLQYCHRINLPTVSAFLFFGSHHNSAFHVVMLSAMRFFLVLRPLKYKQIISNRRVNIASAFVWVVSFIIGFIFAISTSMTSKESEINIGYSGYIFFIPCFLIIVFHILKIRRATKTQTSSRLSLSSSTRSISLSSAIKRKMNIIISLIISFYIIPCFIDGAWFIMALSKTEDSMTNAELSEWITSTGSLASLMWLLNYASNPVIYFFFSKRISALLCCCCLQ